MVTVGETSRRGDVSLDGVESIHGATQGGCDEARNNASSRGIGRVLRYRTGPYLDGLDV